MKTVYNCIVINCSRACECKVYLPARLDNAWAARGGRHVREWLRTISNRQLQELWMSDKDDADKNARENWRLARELDQAGKSEMADEARQRAINWEKARDSWLYRTFGW